MYILKPFNRNEQQLKEEEIERMFKDEINFIFNTINNPDITYQDAFNVVLIKKLAALELLITKLLCDNEQK